MQHFFTTPENIKGHDIVIRGEDVNHIKNVLRMKAGEEISVSNGVDDNEYRAEIVSILEDEVICRLMFIKEAGVELPAEIVLFQGLPKSDKMDLIVQKAVELGAS
nr:16S rRNA (uracil(1498)-N(3))-methyltransferase [Lachnospiraceae bacterium]